jgi:hypothetical protein
MLEVRFKLSSISQRDTNLEIAVATMFTQWLSNQGEMDRNVVRKLLMIVMEYRESWLVLLLSSIFAEEYVAKKYPRIQRTKIIKLTIFRETTIFIGISNYFFPVFVFFRYRITEPRTGTLERN